MSPTSHIPAHWTGTPPKHGLATDVCIAAIRRAYHRGVFRLNQRILENPFTPLKPHHVTTLRKGIEHARGTDALAPMRRAVITALLKYTEALDLTIAVADSDHHPDIDIQPTDQRALNLLHQLCAERDAAVAEYEKHQAAGTTPEKDSPAHLYTIHDNTNFKHNPNAAANHAWRLKGQLSNDDNASDNGEPEKDEEYNGLLHFPFSSRPAAATASTAPRSASPKSQQTQPLPPAPPNRFTTKRMRGNLNLPRNKRGH